MLTIKEYILNLDERLKAMEEAYQELLKMTKEIKSIVTDLKNMQFGNWEIKDKQMIFYDLDGNELARFNLYDKDGKPSDVAVFKRERVE